MPLWSNKGCWCSVYDYITLAINIFYYFIAAVGLLFISSGVTMTLPFAVGKIIDIIYNSQSEGANIKDTLVPLCQILGVVFIIGAIANFGRVYLIQTSGIHVYSCIFLVTWKPFVSNNAGWMFVYLCKQIWTLHIKKLSRSLLKLSVVL